MDLIWKNKFVSPRDVYYEMFLKIYIIEKWYLNILINVMVHNLKNSLLNKGEKGENAWWMVDPLYII